jgi:hypothetical protein
MNLQKINNFAITLALALGFACAPALSSLSVVQAQVPSYPPVRGPGYQQPQARIVTEQNPYSLGIVWGRDDAWKGAEFRPCAHQEFIWGNKHFRRDFTNGYSQGYFGGGYYTP